MRIAFYNHNHPEMNNTNFKQKLSRATKRFFAHKLVKFGAYFLDKAYKIDFDTCWLIEMEESERRAIND